MGIQEVAEALGMTLVERQNRVWSNCLWHEDRDPSLIVGGRKPQYQNCCYCVVCGERHSTIDLVMQYRQCTLAEAREWLAEKRGKTERPLPPPSPRGGSEPVRVGDYLPCCTPCNALVQCLTQLFPAERVMRVAGDYRLGALRGLSPLPHTLFPSIDAAGRVHQVKLQVYETRITEPDFCHSVHDETRYVGERLFDPRRFALDTHCLFGQHLLPLRTDCTVVLVESPKNAVVGACRWPQLLWVATGSKGMLSRQLLEPLRGREVIVLPDRDAQPEWERKVLLMADIAHFRMSRFHQEHSDWGNAKCDIADWVIETVMKPSSTSSSDSSGRGS